MKALRVVKSVFLILSRGYESQYFNWQTYKECVGLKSNIGKTKEAEVS